MSVLKQTPVQNPLDFSYFLCYCTKQVKVRDFLDAAASLPLFLFPLSILPVGHSNRGTAVLSVPKRRNLSSSVGLKPKPLKINTCMMAGKRVSNHL